MQTQEQNQKESRKENAELKEFKKDEKEAHQEWEDVKDESSGVDKTLEKKLEDNTVTPKDIEKIGD